MATTATIKDKKLTIVVDLETPRPSQSGKTLLVASDRVKFADVQVNGKPVTVALNAYIPAK